MEEKELEIWASQWKPELEVGDKEIY